MVDVCSVVVDVTSVVVEVGISVVVVTPFEHTNGFNSSHGVSTHPSFRQSAPFLPTRMQSSTPPMLFGSFFIHASIWLLLSESAMPCPKAGAASVWFCSSMYTHSESSRRLRRVPPMLEARRPLIQNWPKPCDCASVQMARRVRVFVMMARAPLSASHTA